MEVTKGTDHLLPSSASSGKASCGDLFCCGVSVFGSGWHEMTLTHEWWRSAAIIQREVVHSCEIKVSFLAFHEACWLKQLPPFEINIYISLCLWQTSTQSISKFKLLSPKERKKERRKRRKENACLTVKKVNISHFLFEHATICNLSVMLTLELIVNDWSKNISTFCANIHERSVSLIEIWGSIDN